MIAAFTLSGTLPSKAAQAATRWRRSHKPDQHKAVIGLNRATSDPFTLNLSILAQVAHGLVPHCGAPLRLLVPTPVSSVSGAGCGPRQWQFLQATWVESRPRVKEIAELLSIDSVCFIAWSHLHCFPEMHCRTLRQGQHGIAPTHTAAPQTFIYHCHT